MKDWKVSVSLRWAREATFNVLRRIHLTILAECMLEDVVPERQEYWRERLRGVDTHVRSLYYGPKVNNFDNGPTIIALQQSNPTSKEDRHAR